MTPERRAQRRFTPEDRLIVETCLRHNLGVRLGEAVRNLLLDFYDAEKELAKFKTFQGPIRRDAAKLSRDVLVCELADAESRALYFSEQLQVSDAKLEAAEAREKRLQRGFDVYGRHLKQLETLLRIAVSASLVPGTKEYLKWEALALEALAETKEPAAAESL